MTPQLAPDDPDQSDVRAKEWPSGSVTKIAWRPVLFVAAVAFLAKCLLALLTYGTNDITTFTLDLAKVSTQGASALYREGIQFSARGITFPVQVFSHPPAMINVLKFWEFLHRVTGLPLQFWMRFSCALADAVGLIVLSRIAQLTRLRLTTPNLILIAACPISIMISGFHGNTDPIMVLFVLVSVYFTEADRPGVAGIWFGLALCVKIVPLMLGFVFLLYFPSVRSRVRFMGAAAAVFFVACLPWLASDFMLIVRSLLSYNGLPGVWSAALSYFGFPIGVQKNVFIILVTAASFLMNRPGRKRPLFAQVGVIVTLFLLFSPGFAVQYLAWSVPWVVYLGARTVSAYFALSGCFLAVTYTHWSGGFPWYAADAISFNTAGLQLLVACWAMLAFMLGLYVVRLQAEARLVRDVSLERAGAVESL